MAHMRTLTWVDVDYRPYTVNGYEAGDIALASEWFNLPDPVAEKMLAVASGVDQWTCETDGCDGAVGERLHGDADEQMAWRHTAFVAVEGEDDVKAVCEECSPGMLL